MRGQNLYSMLAMLVCSSAFGDDTDPKLSVQFATAQATIAPRAPDKPVQFPDMTFTLHATASCPPAQLPASVSISIADSRITIAPDDNGRFEEEIRVSAQQLAPVIATDFCLIDEIDDEIDGAIDDLANQESGNVSEQVTGAAPDEETGDNPQMEIRGALSAQLSLRCKGENSESISYTTAPLNVALLCETPEQKVPELQEIVATPQPTGNLD